MSAWSYIVGKGLNGIALSLWYSDSSACSKLYTSLREKRRILHSLLHSQEVWIVSAPFSDSLISLTFGIFLVVMLSSSCSCSSSLWMMISLMCRRIKYQSSKSRTKISFVILLLKVIRDWIKVFVRDPQILGLGTEWRETRNKESFQKIWRWLSLFTKFMAVYLFKICLVS